MAAPLNSPLHSPLRSPLRSPFASKWGSEPQVRLSANSIAEDAADNTVVGALTVANLPAGITVSSYSITADPDNKFAISTTNLIIDELLDYETATSHSVTVRATLSDASTVDRTFSITVTNVFEAASLNALTLNTDEIEEGSAEDTLVGTLQSTTGGSTLSLTDTAGGRFKLTAGTIVAGATATDYASATSHNITVRETLADSANSPRDSVIAITVTEVGAVVTRQFMLSGNYINSTGAIQYMTPFGMVNEA
jgi:hypothetical protein